MAGTITDRPGSDLARWREDTPGCARVAHLNNAGRRWCPAPSAMPSMPISTWRARSAATKRRDARGRVQEVYAAVGRLSGARARTWRWSRTPPLPLPRQSVRSTSDRGTACSPARMTTPPTRSCICPWRKEGEFASFERPMLPKEGSIPKRCAAWWPGSGQRWLPLPGSRPIRVWSSRPSASVEICRSPEVPYLVDACQAVGQMPIDVARLGCDFLAATARKFVRGPRGLGSSIYRIGCSAGAPIHS